MNNSLKLLTALGIAVSLAGCVVAPPPARTYVPQPAPLPMAAPVPQLAIYPAHGQSQDQLQRDRTECSTWATTQTGFDPSAPPPQRAFAQPANAPGTGTAIGAIAGAVLGAALSNRWQTGAGMVFGGLTGAAIGSTADASAQMQANAQQAQLNQDYAAQRAAQSAAAASYRRAMGACLDARGYTIG